jgi:DNA-binding NtrC family response regulator
MSRAFSVLVVEDHDSHRQTLEELLAGRGWKIFAADRGATALELARREKLDFGLLDMHLPGRSGLELFQAIALEIGPLPAIMMSGEATAAETEAAINAGVFTFLPKPIEAPLLQRCLDRLIQTHFPFPPSQIG